MEGQNNYSFVTGGIFNIISQIIQDNAHHIMAGFNDCETYNHFHTSARYGHRDNEKVTYAIGESSHPSHTRKEAKTALASSGNCEYKVPPSLAGVWKNELKSTMEIFPTTNVKGQFSGKYRSIVGNAEDFYDLVGRYDVDGDETKGTLGWTVNWNNAIHGNSESTTTWSGQRFVVDCNNTINTTWLLTRQTDKANSWGSTRVGKDTFVKIC